MDNEFKVFQQFRAGSQDLVSILVLMDNEFKVIGQAACSIAEHRVSILVLMDNEFKERLFRFCTT